MKDNEIEVTSLSDLLRYIELSINKSNVPVEHQEEFISKFQHVAKQGFDIGKNGITYFEIGE